MKCINDMVAYNKQRKQMGLGKGRKDFTFNVNLPSFCFKKIVGPQKK